ncbi:MAG: DoxX family protein [Candidatus Bathyarchaeia archaeon]
MPDRSAGNTWWTRYNSELAALLRIGFGFVWVIDGMMKFVYMVPSDVVDMVQASGQGQPSWLGGWFNFWLGLVSANPSIIMYAVGVLELLLGFALILGFMRKIAYLAGIFLSLMIWSVDEGFGGPYGPGSTDIGAAVMYAFVFFALLIIDASYAPNKYSLDAIIETRKEWWSKLAELR